MNWIDHNDICHPKMNMVEGIIESSKTSNLLPHLHELVYDKASDQDGKQSAQLTAALQRNVDMFLCPGQT